MKIVVKLGSSSLTNGSIALSRPHMVEFARQIAQIHNDGHKVILVCSGAIVAGREVLKIDACSTSTKQMLASIGQVRLMHLWTELFALYGITIGQILLSRNDFANPAMNLNARNTLSEMFTHSILPIVNENDTVATDEITSSAFEENDALSALVAGHIDADLLLLLTDQDGLYTKDPRFHPDAKRIATIEKIDEAVAQYGNKSQHDNSVGTGGMKTKIQAANRATSLGIDVIIAQAQENNILIRILSGEKLGTHFVSQKDGRESSRMRSFFKNNDKRTKESSSGCDSN